MIDQFNYNEAQSIRMSEWRIFDTGEIIETGGLGPCVGIIIYNPISKQATVGHFSDPRHEDIKGMITSTINKFRDQDKLIVHLGGASPFDTSSFEGVDEDINKYEQIRKFTIKTLTDYGFNNNQININWENDENMTTIMRICTNTGNVEYLKESIRPVRSLLYDIFGQ